MIDGHLASNPVGGTQEYLGQYRNSVTDHREWVAYARVLVDHSAQGSLLQRFAALDRWCSSIYGTDDPPEVVGQLARHGIPTTPILEADTGRCTLDPTTSGTRLAIELELRLRRSH